MPPSCRTCWRRFPRDEAISSVTAAPQCEALEGRHARCQCPKRGPARVEVSWPLPVAPPDRDHRRSRAETKMNCVKLLGQKLMARDFERQVAELQVRIAILNRYTALGIPVT